jgi:hypothetical protein
MLQNVTMGTAATEGFELYLYRYTVGMYWVPGYAGLRGNEITDEVLRGVSIQK